jgi:hypothetical protein
MSRKMTSWVTDPATPQSADAPVNRHTATRKVRRVPNRFLDAVSDLLLDAPEVDATALLSPLNGIGRQLVTDEALAISANRFVSVAGDSLFPALPSQGSALEPPAEPPVPALVVGHETSALMASISSLMTMGASLA